MYSVSFIAGQVEFSSTYVSAKEALKAASSTARSLAVGNRVWVHKKGCWGSILVDKTPIGVTIGGFLKPIKGR